MYFEMSCRNIGMLTADYCLCPHAVFKVIALCALRCFFFPHIGVISFFTVV